MNNYPTFRQLQYFLALKETLSFSRAAERCFVTQSTLSTSISDLEAMLGNSLFERTSRRVIVTKFGKEFEVQARNMVAQADSMMMQVSKNNDEPAGDIHIGVIPTIAPFYMRRFMTHFMSLFPSLNPVFHEGLSDVLLTQLKAGALDFAILALPYDIDSMVSHIIRRDKFYCAIPESYEAETVTLKKLKKMDVLLLEEGHCLSDHAISACGLGVNKKKDQVHKLSSISTMLGIAEQLQKPTLITAMMKNYVSRVSNLKVIPIEGADQFRDIVLIHRPNTPVRSIVDRLIAV